MTRDPSPQLLAALDYAKRGWAVFPIYQITPSGRCACRKNNCGRDAGKHPRTDHGFKDATTDESQIREWWAKWPSANVGVATGAVSGIVTLDEDPKNGGDRSLASLEEKHGRLPRTVEAESGSGGGHYHFRYPKDRRVGRKIGLPGAPGIDLLGDGGYVIMPPSNHQSGGRYAWIKNRSPDEAEFAELPRWILDLLSVGASSSADSVTKKARLASDADSKEAQVGRADADAIKAECPWFAHTVEDSATLPEPEWHAMLSIVGRCRDGGTLAHEYSEDHPQYDPKRTEKKLAHSLKAGPRTCENIRAALGAEDYCKTCPHAGRITSPIQLGDPRGPTARLIAAKRSLVALPQDLKKNKTAAFKPEVVSALAVMKAHDAAAFVEHRDAAKSAGVPLRILDREIAKAQLTVVPKGAGGLTVTGIPAAVMLKSDYAPDAPTDLLAPSGYKLAASETTRVVIDKDTGTPTDLKIAHAPILITGRLVDIDDRSVHLLVAWRRPAGWNELKVDRRVAMDANQLVTLAGCDFPVSSTVSKQLVRYLQEFEALNLSRLPCAQVSSHLGWQGERGQRGFLWGRNRVTPDGKHIECAELDGTKPAKWNPDCVLFRGLAAGDEQIAGAYRFQGTLDGWKDTVRPLRKYPRALFALFGSFAAPLLEILSLPNFGIDLPNRTSTGKTTSLRVGASPWGDPDETKPNAAIRTWDSTPVGIERTACVISGLPLILDETKRARKQEDVARVLYMVGSGQGRVRGNPRGLAVTRTFHTVLLSSGEAPITSFTADGGTRTRVLVVRGLPFGAADAKTRIVVSNLNAGVFEHYGHAGPIIVQWLLQRRSTWEKLARQHQQLARDLSRRVKGPEAGRLAQYAAAVQLAGDIAGQALGDPWRGADPVDELWESIAAQAVDASGAKRALLDAYDWAVSQRAAFFDRYGVSDDANKPPPGGWLGRWDADGHWAVIGFNRPKLEKYLAERGYSPTAIIDEWEAKGWLKADTGHNTLLISVNGIKQRLVAVKDTAIDEVLK